VAAHANGIIGGTPDQENVALWQSEQRKLLDYLRSVDPTSLRDAH
jgi:hypothetical protein